MWQTYTFVHSVGTFRPPSGCPSGQRFFFYLTIEKVIRLCTVLILSGSFEDVGIFHLYDFGDS